MTSNNIVIYPRGFIGFDTGLVSDKASGVDMAEWFRSIKLNKPILQEASSFKGIPQIDNLWQQYEERIKFITSFEFREDILKTALVCFGTLSFFDWCNLQNKNIYFTSLHKKFLNDTFNFIETGNRSINILSWKSLLSLKEVGPNDTPLEYNINDFFRVSQGEDYRRSFRLADALSEWVSKENGFEDLLLTLNILFGSEKI